MDTVSSKPSARTYSGKWAFCWIVHKWGPLTISFLFTRNKINKPHNGRVLTLLSMHFKDAATICPSPLLFPHKKIMETWLSSKRKAGPPDCSYTFYMTHDGCLITKNSLDLFASEHVPTLWVPGLWVPPRSERDWKFLHCWPSGPGTQISKISHLVLQKINFKATIFGNTRFTFSNFTFV